MDLNSNVETRRPPLVSNRQLTCVACAGGAAAAAGARAGGARAAVARVRRLVPRARRQVRQERDRDAPHAAVPVPALRVHGGRRALLRRVRAHRALAEDAQLLHALVLR